MNGGEDYELVFAVPLEMHERLQQIDGIRIIGHMTKPELGCALITRDENEITITAQGWNAFKQ